MSEFWHLRKNFCEHEVYVYVVPRLVMVCALRALCALYPCLCPVCPCRWLEGVRAASRCPTHTSPPASLCSTTWSSSRRSSRLPRSRTAFTNSLKVTVCRPSVCNSLVSYQGLVTAQPIRAWLRPGWQLSQSVPGYGSTNQGLVMARLTAQPISAWLRLNQSGPGYGPADSSANQCLVTAQPIRAWLRLNQSGPGYGPADSSTNQGLVTAQPIRAWLRPG